jgi:hypothetical protein
MLTLIGLDSVTDTAKLTTDGVVDITEPVNEGEEKRIVVIELPSCNSGATLAPLSHC